nr:hypothetical protein [Micromonospora sp. DSM 115978]
MGLTEDAEPVAVPPSASEPPRPPQQQTSQQKPPHEQPPLEQVQLEQVQLEQAPPPEQHRGPVVARRGQVQHSTTDQRLLDTRSPGDFVHGDPWRVLRI